MSLAVMCVSYIGGGCVVVCRVCSLKLCAFVCVLCVVVVWLVCVA
jgi:hypothetical protein